MSVKAQFFDGANSVECVIIARFVLIGDILIMLPSGKFLSVAAVHVREKTNETESPQNS